MTPDPGYLMIGLTPDESEVVINYPSLVMDENGAGHIVLSANQAQGMAEILIKKAADVQHAPDELLGIQLFAWLGKDELGSGVVGLKQGLVPAGYIPLVSIKKDKVSKLAGQMNDQAREYGNKIYLCKFVLTEVLEATLEGEPLL